MKTLTSFLVLSCALYTGCAVGTDYPQQAEVASPAAFSQTGEWHVPQTKQWWTLYQDPQLTALIEKASAQNHDLAALYQRTIQARAIISRSKADGRPQLGAGASYERFQDSDNISSTGLNEELYSGSVTLGWELDIFGRVARLVESAQAEALASEAAYRQLLLITQSDVAINYYRLRATVREIDALNRSVETRRESYAIVNERFESGSVSDLDVAQAETLLAVSEADLAQLQRTRDVIKHALAVLTGEPAPDFALQVEKIEGSPIQVPVGLPSELLHQRPDILQAEHTLQAARAQIGVAKANFYPRLSIGAESGQASYKASTFFDSTANFFAIGPQLSVPLFQGGRLRADLSRAESAYIEAVENYKQTVIKAFAEVENALSGWKYLATQRAANERAVQASRRAQSISDYQYRNGVIDFITALDSERSALESERRLARVIGDEYENSVLLIRAIGGSWN